MSKTDATPTDRSRRGKGWVLGIGVATVLIAVAVVVWWLRLPTARELAERAMDRGDLRTAERALLQHLTATPSDHSARLRLADLVHESDPLRALAHLRQIPEGSDQYLDAVRRIAGIYILANLHSEAEWLLKTVVAANEDDFGIQLSLAELYHGNRDRKALAVPHARKAIELQPQRARSYLLLAEILDDLNQIDDMVEPLQQAIKLDPDLYEAHINLAYAALFVGNVELAESEAKWCLQRDADDVAARRFLASVAQERGQIDLAFREIRSALKLAPQDRNCRMLEAELLLFQRQAARAYERLKPLVKEHSDYRPFLALLVRAAAMTGHRDEARGYERQLRRLMHDPSEE